MKATDISLKGLLKEALTEMLEEQQSFLQEAMVKAIEKARSKAERPALASGGGRKTIVVDAKEYKLLIERLELLEDIQTAELQLDAGKGIRQKSAKQKVLSRLK